MKVTIYETVEVEAEVRVSIEQIAQALREALAEASDEAAGRHIVHDLGQSIYQVLRGIDDAMIARCSEPFRECFARALIEQAARYKRPENPTP